jgi:hypothetical protein
MSDEWRMDQSVKEVEFEYRGKKVVLKVKPMTWSKKNQIISQATAYSKEGEGKFNLDFYNKECLKYMIIEAPWGETNNIFLSQIDDELGDKLQQIVPGPGAIGEKQVSFFGHESKSSSMEEVEPQT